MALFLDYLYAFRFFFSSVLLILFSLLWIIFHKSKAKKVFKVLFFVFLGINIIISVLRLTLPNTYKCRVDENDAYFLAEYAKENLKSILDRSYITIDSEEYSIQAYANDYDDRQTAEYYFDHACKSFNKTYCVSDSDGKDLFIDDGNQKIYFTQIAYYDRCLIWFPIAYNYYAADVYVLTDNYIIEFRNTSLRLSNASIKNWLNELV